MSSVLVHFSPIWSVDWLHELSEYIDVSNEFPDTLRYLYDAVGCYLFWRTRVSTLSDMNRILADILQGYHLYDVPSELLVYHWEKLFNDVGFVLKDLNKRHGIQRLELVFERLESSVIVVTC